MLITPAPPQPLLELAHRPGLDVLLGRWAYQPVTQELPMVYQHTEAVAADTKRHF